MAGATLAVRDSPDDFQAGVNLRALPAIQQDTRCRRLLKADKHQSFLGFNRRAIRQPFPKNGTRILIHRRVHQKVRWLRLKPLVSR
jgi:hypothetical protein